MCRKLVLYKCTSFNFSKINSMQFDLIINGFGLVPQPLYFLHTSVVLLLQGQFRCLYWTSVPFHQDFFLCKTANEKWIQSSLKITFHQRSNFRAGKIQPRANIERLCCYDNIEHLQLSKIHKLRVERWYQFIKLESFDWFSIVGGSLYSLQYSTTFLRVADLFSGR